MNKSMNFNYEQWIEKISKDLPEDYQIGLHQVGVFGTEESKKAVRRNNPITYLRKIKPKDYCESIMKTGLKNRWNNILYTLAAFGSVDKIRNNIIRQQEFLNYQYDAENLDENKNLELYDVIVATPRQISIGRNTYLLGNLSHPGDMEDSRNSVGERIFKNSDIPSEFIYGYICKQNERVEFTPNQQHISLKSELEQEMYFSKLIREKGISPIELEDKEIDNEKNGTRGPIDALKDMQTAEQKEILSLLQEKEDLTAKGMIPYRKFNFLERHLTKRKQYKEYITDRESALNANKENQKRVQEINKLLLAKGNPSITNIKQRIDDISKAKTFEELGIKDSNEAIEILITKGIKFKFESYQQAFELAPEFFGRNPEFMKKAIREDIKFIGYDKTDDEELYREVINLRIKELEVKKEKGDFSEPFEDISVPKELKELYYLKQEIENPKQVEKGKYKIPHKFMFEELRNNISRNELKYWYSQVDGVYDKEFGEELQALYENPDIIVGVHGLDENEYIENKIFTQGLKNSMQNADVTLDRTVAFGKDLAFTSLLNYRIPYNSNETESAIILTLPKKALDKENPVPIWGSHNPQGSDNYVLPQCVYGLYHAKSDGNNRKVIKNPHVKQEEYEYLRYDKKSSKHGTIQIKEEQQK